eukprot:748920-Heterocapsa_arctica.AAC.1
MSSWSLRTAPSRPCRTCPRRLYANQIYQWALQVFDWSSGIIAITIIFLAERWSVCTTSELESQF